LYLESDGLPDRPIEMRRYFESVRCMVNRGPRMTLSYAKVYTEFSFLRKNGERRIEISMNIGKKLRNGTRVHDNQAIHIAEQKYQVLFASFGHGFRPNLCK
jgi:hypothetical protein